MYLKTTNPVFKPYFWRSKHYGLKNKMTLTGILLKTLLGLFLVAVSVLYVWRLKRAGLDTTYYLYGGMIVAVTASVLTSYKQRWASVTVPIYAIAKGCFLGAITSYANFKYQDLAQKAIFYTIIAFLVMLILYKMDLIKVTKKFKSILYSAIATIFSIYFISFILHFFGIHFNIIYGSSWVSIIFTIIVVSIASFSLLLDFDYIQRYINKAPKYKEWIATWGLLVTLIWMYIEIFRLLKKITTR